MHLAFDLSVSSLSALKGIPAHLPAHLPLLSGQIMSVFSRFGLFSNIGKRRDLEQEKQY